MKTRYALVGVGSRGMGMFARPIRQEFGDVAELVGLCDRNALRLALAQRQLGLEIPTYTDFGRMLAETRPDVVIVCTVDATHRQFTVAALEAGCDVITEKPMATTPEAVRAIRETEIRTGHSVHVSFNARYGAPTEKLYELLRAGTIGQILSAEFTEYLNTSHGADYFRRWHRRKENSGGLLIHKATHHFDQLNWWLGADPQTVYAQGGLRYYGPTRKERGERCLTCEYQASCPFCLDLASHERMRTLYLECEADDGYFRDRCVFADDIDIEDTLSVTIRYENDVLVTYSLCAYAPYEGQRISFNGTLGRIEIDLVREYHRSDETGQLAVLPMDVPLQVRVNPLFGAPHDVPISERTGGHGGADERIREHLFRPGTPDPLNQIAGTRAGAMSVLIGAAGNISIATGQAVRIADLV